MENIIGHEKVKNILNKIIAENKVGHAYLFTGKEGIGKQLVAKEFAKKILNEDENSFQESNLIIVNAENDVIKVETIRNIIEDIYLKPVYTNNKVIIINDADKMNSNAQNALLKVLEEPPIYAIIILITAHKEKIIKTILSRTTEIAFEGLSQKEIQMIVGDDINLEYAQGSVSKALSLKEENDIQYATDLLEVMNRKDFINLNRRMTEIKQEGADIIKILELLKMMYYKTLKENTQEKVRIIELIDNTIKNLSRNANTDLALDKFMIELCRG